MEKLWKEGFITLGWDEGRNTGFITIKNRKTINKLIKLFGNDNIILDNYRKNIKLNKLAKYEINTNLKHKIIR